MNANQLINANRLLAAMDTATDAAAANRLRLDDFPAAIALREEIDRIRLARGDAPLGYKIGFTNRSLWPIYKVDSPILAPVWRSSVDCALPSGNGRKVDLLEVGRPLLMFNRPRLEPEIVLGLSREPASDALDDVAAAVAWVAHGFEIVQSPWPDWQFSAAEAMASQGLHGALLIGPRSIVRRADGLADALSAVRVSIACNDDDVATGEGSAVLDGPVQALSYLVRMLAANPPSHPVFRLGAGSIVTTGTLTDAQPMRSGQRWRTRIEMAPRTAGAASSASLAHALRGIELAC